MSKKNDLIRERVEMLLRAKVEDRNSDFTLLNDYIDTYCVDTKDITFDELMRNHTSYGVPSFEGITRARRRVQKDNPDLCGNREVKQGRSEEEERFRLDYGYNY